MLINGKASNDKLTGTTRNDVINGLDGNDIISGLGGADRLNGGGGNDLITFAFDTLVDTITGGGGIDTLKAPLRITGPVTMTGNLQTGASIFSAGKLIASVSGIEVLSLTGSNADDKLIGGSGNDELSGLAGRDTMATGAGNDTARIAVDAKADVIDLGSGNDRFDAAYSGGLDVSFTLARGTATLALAKRTAATVTGAEIYEVQGGTGNDNLNGGDLNDRLDGDAGANTIFGGAGDDIFSLMLDAGTDSVRGGKGMDRMQVFSNGTDKVFTAKVGPGYYDVTLNRTVRIAANGIEAVDVFGGAADDTLDGLVGTDNLFGAGGADSLDGRDGNDNLVGGSGNDTFDGGSGNDTIQGDAGNDRLLGGPGNDRFVFNHPSADGKDFIVDFSSTDFIVVDDAGFAGLVPGRPVSLIRSALPTPPAGSTAPVFLFDIDTGDLGFDRDGDGAGASQALYFATVRAVAGGQIAALTAGDILVI